MNPRLEKLRQELQAVIRGKDDAIDLALTCVLASGHLLIEDVPGVGKTTLAYAIARALGGSFRKIQFTSDLLPSDLTGISVFNPGQAEFEFRPGPLFANVVLADEINRTTPKTQSALLEAMNEGRVTVDGRTYSLPRPFLVVATQNPVEHHGTYPLPESQMDRFLMRIRMGYPDRGSEREILRDPPRPERGTWSPVLTGEELESHQRAVEGVSLHPSLEDYLLAIVGRTRSDEAFLLGVSPRGSLALLRAAQAAAHLAGRPYVVPDDIKGMAIPVLSHRVVLSGHFAPGGAGAGTEEAAIAAVLENIEVPA